MKAVTFVALLVPAAVGLGVSCPKGVKLDKPGPDLFDCQGSTVVPSPKIRLVKTIADMKPNDCLSACSEAGNCAFAVVNGANDCLMYGRSTLFAKTENITLTAGNDLVIVNADFTNKTAFDLTLNCPTNYLLGGPPLEPLPYCTGSTAAPTNGTSLTTNECTLDLCFTACTANTACAFATFPSIGPYDTGTCEMFGMTGFWDRTSSLTLSNGSDVVIINPSFYVVTANKSDSSSSSPLSFSLLSGASSSLITIPTPFVATLYIFVGLGFCLMF